MVDYINKSFFKTEILLVEEKNEILDTGGGVLNCLLYTSDAADE